MAIYQYLRQRARAWNHCRITKVLKLLNVFKVLKVLKASKEIKLKLSNVYKLNCDFYSAKVIADVVLPNYKTFLS